MDEMFRSRLGERAGEAPARGIGAGIAANQKVAGAKDPEAAARAAALGEGAYQEERERAAKLAEETEGRKEELLTAYREGRWAPKETLPKGISWVDVLGQQTPETIARWHAEFVSKSESELEAQDERLIQDALRQDFSIQPDDHLYDPLVDKERRARLEALLTPLDFEQMLFSGYTDQEIQIHPSLKITLRTVSTQQVLWLEHHVASLPDTSQQVLRHTLGLLQVAVSLDKLNGRDIGPPISQLHKSGEREPFYEALKVRMEFLGRLPNQITDDFIVQFIWFGGRVRKMLSGNLTERVGNS